MIKENCLSGAADRARQARRGQGFHTGKIHFISQDRSN